jgi:hypothetical protein
MADRRCRGLFWNIADEAGTIYPNMRDGVTVALLMDIRDELQQMNRVWGCHNFQRIPQILDAIAVDAKRRTRLAKAKAARKRGATMRAKAAR